MADTDISQFLNGLQRAGEEQKRLALQAVDVFGVQVLGNAQDRCPVEFGDLKASATDLPAEFEGDSIVKVLGFNRFYAAMVHEILTNNHTQGEAKFLHNAMAELTPKFGPFVAGYVKGGA